MRILMATGLTYLPQRVGGAQSSMHDFAEALIARGHEVAILASLDISDRLGQLNRLKRNLFRWNRYPCDRWAGYKVYRGWNPASGVREIVRRFQPDIIFIHVEDTLRFAAASRAINLPAVVYLHDVEFHNLTAEPHDLTGITWLANSHYTANKFKATYGLEATVLHNIIKKENYQVPDHKGGYVTFINPHPWKGVELAFAIAQTCPDIPFLFVECWRLPKQEQAALQKRIQQTNNITWRPRSLDMREVYRDTSLLIVPSQCEEAWGRVVTEAQINSIPVLASNRGGLPEAVGNGGLILPQDDPAPWIEAIHTLWYNAEQRLNLGIAAGKRANAIELSLPYIAQTLEDHLLQAATFA
ncbi:glycosyltransferase [Candidatus Contendibacter odensensis]|uniref:Glycosyltransferase subfamily 4-like N-terminal domain-containing protein n=1 Tax=Candidatus Contendobacter odensis Run_B_J11 TaxID=1400861 RepID=A0A7U7G7F4_9GAMM|nr:glycosyltransferase [Candidatus Contendobacter odensis]CDH43069.1 conserved hypothetical protein [Candidatus Contendobacter odensis Run_B_J11]